MLAETMERVTPYDLSDGTGAAPIDASALGIDEVGPTDAELAAFAGPRAAYYLERWNRGRRWGFNWPAFFFGPFWLGYRKLYGVMAAVFVYFIGTTVLVAVLRKPFATEPGFLDTVRGAFTLAVAVWLGKGANYYYFRRAVRAIAASRAAGLDVDARLEWLGRRGGRSTLTLGVSMLVWFVAAFVVIVLVIAALKAI